VEAHYFTSEIPRASVQAFVANSQKAGFMKTRAG